MTDIEKISYLNQRKIELVELYNNLTTSQQRSFDNRWPDINNLDISNIDYVTFIVKCSIENSISSKRNNKIDQILSE